MNLIPESRMNRFLFETTGVTFNDVTITANLTARERAVLSLYFGTDKTMDEIGKEFGVTSSRIREIVQKALRKIRGCISYKFYSAIKAVPGSTKEIQEVKHFAFSNPSVRLYNAIVRDIVMTKRLAISIKDITIPLIVDLYSTPEDLMKIRNFGVKSHEELYKIVHNEGYQFKWEKSVPSDYN